MKILAATASMESAMKLRDAIEKLVGLEQKSILVSHNSGACRDHKVIMRYGSSFGNLDLEPEWGNPGFSQLCIHKDAFSNAFKSIITVPIFIDDSFPESFPVLVRSTLTGAQSAGITLVHNPKEFMNSWTEGSVWTKYYHFDFEVRVYAVFLEDNIAFRIYKKVPRDDVELSDEFITGLDGEDNAAWLLKDAGAYPKVRSILERMRTKVLEMGGRFVGIDMIYSRELRDYVTLELNSGPWLTLSTASWLANIFIRDQWSKFQ